MNRHHTSSTITLAVLAAGLGFTALAQTIKQKPGLWETTIILLEQKGTLLDFMSAEERKGIDSAPPDQRAKWIALLTTAPAPKEVVKTCLTDERAVNWGDAAKSFIEPPETGCKVVTSKVTQGFGDVVHRCTKEGGPNTIRHTSFSMPNSTTLEIVREMATEDGKLKQKMKITSRWLGAACGDVKP